MEVLIKGGQLILSLAILVTLHELGHFLAARAFGIRVEKFFIFFDAWGKKLFSFKYKETEYGIGWLPLGGYVKISGMIDESVDKEQMKKPAESWEFRSKPAWQRFIVMIGGIVMNLILGFLLFWMVLYRYESKYLPIESVNEKGIVASQTAQEIGFANGDKLLQVNGKEKIRFKDFTSIEVLFGAEISIERNGVVKKVQIPSDFISRKEKKMLLFEPQSEVFVKSLTTKLNPNATNAGLRVNDQIMDVNGSKVLGFGDLVDKLGNFKGDTADLLIQRDNIPLYIKCLVDSTGKIGIAPDIRFSKLKQKSYTLSEAFAFGLNDGWNMIYYNAAGFGKIFNGEIKATDSVQSPIGIANLFPSKWEWSIFWRLTAIISLILAFMNALPIPALDGGHMLFLIIEMIQRKPLSDRTLLIAQYIGMAILLSLMAFAFGNDIFKLFTNGF